MSQNLANGQNTNALVGSAGVDVNVDLGSGNIPCIPDTPTPPVVPPETPTTIRDVLFDLVNEQVQVTTPFGVVTGTLLSVKTDYIVVIDTSGDQVLVRIDKIEFISEV